MLRAQPRTLLPTLLPTLLLTGACGPASAVHGPRADKGGDTSTDLSDVVYDPEHLLQVSIEMEEADWDALREQTRDAFDLLTGDCQSEPFENPFTWFPGTITLDGETVGTVGVRKKGFLGSLSVDKPSLKIDTDEYVDGLHWMGLDDLTFNNAISDPSLVRQCLGFGVFAAADVPASRCNFARIEVNGKDLGVYVNVEPVQEPFLARHFSSDAGNLYEGTLSDFREGWTGTFSKETNDTIDDRSDIQAVVDALEQDDDTVVVALEPLVDLDAFDTYWAAEVLLTHIDGYSWNTNNFYLYADPADGRFHFIPWGIDACLLSQGQLEGSPASVYAYGELSNRLYALPDARAAYLERLVDLLDTAWDEDALQAELDRMEALILPELDQGADEVASAIDGVRDVVEERRSAILDELSQGSAEWPYAQRESFCMSEVGSLAASFDTTWNTLSTSDPFTTGQASLDVMWGEQALPTIQVGSVAGDTEGLPIIYVAAWMDGTQALIAYVEVYDTALSPGVVPVDFEHAVGALFYQDSATMKDFSFIAYIVGELSLEEASDGSGDPVKGSVTGDLIAWGT